MLCCGAWKATMSKRDYKTNVADGKELEPLDGTDAVDKENSKTNGTQFGEGKCYAMLDIDNSHLTDIEHMQSSFSIQFSTAFDLDVFT